MVISIASLPLDLTYQHPYPILMYHLLGATAQNSTGMTNFQNSVTGNPVVSVPATNLNIGMDLWNASSGAPGAMKMRPNHGVSSAVAPGMMNDQWIQVRVVYSVVCSFYLNLQGKRINSFIKHLSYLDEPDANHDLE